MSNPSRKSKFFGEGPYVPLPVFVLVTGFEGKRSRDSEELEAKIKELIEEHSLTINGLLTGLNHDPVSNINHCAQELYQPGMTFPEFSGRTVQQMLGEWVTTYPNLGVNLLFIEPSSDYSAAVYAWHFKGVRPTSTGISDVSRNTAYDELLGAFGIDVGGCPVTYEVKFSSIEACDTGYGYVKDPAGTRDLANSVLRKIFADPEQREALLRREKPVKPPVNGDGERYLTGGRIPTPSTLDTSSPVPSPHDSVHGHHGSSADRRQPGGKQQRRTDDTKGAKR